MVQRMGHWHEKRERSLTAADLRGARFSPSLASHVAKVRHRSLHQMCSLLPAFAEHES